MKIAPLLYAAFTELQEAAMGLLSGTKIETIAEKINKFAIYSAVAGAAVCAVPGAGGTIAALTQTGLVWTLYVQINKTLGISIKDNVLKFIGSAVLTNLAANAGTYIVAYAAASILSFIPGLGTAGAVLIGAATGYMVIYAAAIVYLKLLTKMMKAKGNFEFDESKYRQILNKTEYIYKGDNSEKLIAIPVISIDEAMDLNANIQKCAKRYAPKS